VLDKIEPSLLIAVYALAEDVAFNDDRLGVVAEICIGTPPKLI
jgi:hypothetical protein